MHNFFLRWLPALLVFILCGGHYLFFHGGYLGYDELEYARLATLFSQGEFSHDSLYAFRYLGFLPLSLLYYVFGAGDFANALISWIYLACIIYLVLRILRIQSLLQIVFTVAFIVCSPLHLLYLEKPMPDIVTETGLLLCIFSLYSQQVNPAHFSFRNGVALFIAGALFIFFSKETFLIIYPLFLWYLFKDMLSRSNHKYWKYIILSGLGFLGVYFLFNHIWLGNFLARVDAIFDNRYISECTYELQPAMVIVRRIAYELWLTMIRMGMMIPLGFAIILPFQKRENLPVGGLFWVRTWFLLLLLSNFMTISYSEYVPLCPDPRHFLYLIPVGTIVMMQGLQSMEKWSKNQFSLLIVVFLIQGLLSYYHKFENHALLYGLLMFGSYLIWKGSKAGFIFAIAGLASVFAQNANYNMTLKHGLQKQLIEEVLITDTNPKYIITDGANTNIGNFYAGYKAELTFVTFQDYKSEMKADRDTYIIMNGLTAYFSNTNWDKVPKELIQFTETQPSFYENEAGKVFLWK